MIEISAQIKGKALYPFSKEDLMRLREYKENQVVRVKITGCKKPRSLKQLRGYWAACKTVSENNESPGWQTKEQVDFQIRVALRFYDPELIIAKPDGSIAFHYRSIAYKNLRHIEACDYFSAAFEIMAKKLGCTIKELLKSVDAQEFIPKKDKEQHDKTT